MYIEKISKKYKIGEGPIIKEVEKKLNKNIENEIGFDSQLIDKKMQMIYNNKKKYDKYIIALLLSKNKNIQNTIFDKIDSNNIEDEKLRKIYNKIKELSINYDLSKVDILSKIDDDELIKEITDVMYIDVSENKEKLLEEVLQKKQKESLIIRRDEIINELSKNISKDESEILNVELNQIILELSKK